MTAPQTTFSLNPEDVDVTDTMLEEFENGNGKKIRIAINGFGRIGRAAFKIALLQKNVEVVAINDLSPVENLSYLLKYDSVYGTYDKGVLAEGQSIVVEGKRYPVFAEKDPSNLPWKKFNIDVVLECTGRFTSAELCESHIKAGAKKVIISAPAKGEKDIIVVLGTDSFNDSIKKNVSVISNASCTTNCIAPVIQVLQTKFGVEKALMTTAHAATASQLVVDGINPKDFREGRAAGVNIIPTSTGAAKATTRVIPELTGLFDGVSLRVPVICGSISDITALLKVPTTVEEVNQAFIDSQSEEQYLGILKASYENLVSTDIIKSTYSAIVDLSLTRVVGGNLVKVFAWYDNEWGYSNRLVDLVEKLSL